MLNILNEIFLDEYFKYAHVASRLLDDTKSVFYKLSDIFLLSDDVRDELYEIAHSDTVQDVVTQNDYMRFLRVNKYSELQDLDTPCNADQIEVLKIKGNAICEAGRIELSPSVDATSVANYKLISDGAGAGKLLALRILGFLQCEGIFFAKNHENGCKSLAKAAQWNSIEGVLTALYYDEKSRALNINRLYTLTYGTPYESILTLAENKYKLTASELLAENKLLGKAFGVGVLKQEIYSAQYARFLFSNVLRTKDKEQLLFTPNNEVLSETADLPLKLAERDILCKASDFTVPLKRDAEKNKILQCVKNSDLRTAKLFRPLCISCDSKFMRNLYADAIERMLPSAQTERLDVADLSVHDFEPSKNNIFVRICNEDVNNVYFMFFDGDVNEQLFEAAKCFVQSDKREAVRLNRPSVLLNLSAILPICFADRANAKKLKQYCDVVTVAQVTSAEKRRLMSFISESKQKQYRISNFNIEDEAIEKLITYSIDKIEEILDEIARTYRLSGDITVTPVLIKEISSAQEGHVYGFGGRINED